MIIKILRPGHGGQRGWLQSWYLYNATTGVSLLRIYYLPLRRQKVNWAAFWRCSEYVLRAPYWYFRTDICCPCKSMSHVYSIYAASWWPEHSGHSVLVLAWAEYRSWKPAVLLTLGTAPPAWPGRGSRHIKIQTYFQLVNYESSDVQLSI